MGFNNLIRVLLLALLLVANQNALAQAQTTSAPSEEPSPAPIAEPTTEPTFEPSPEPSVIPIAEPTGAPVTPQTGPTKLPTFQPTRKPSAEPTPAPSKKPVAAPTRKPTAVPTLAPTMKAPTAKPSARPTPAPSFKPSPAPTTPTAVPTANPTQTPTQPTAEPTFVPPPPINSVGTSDVTKTGASINVALGPNIVVWCGAFLSSSSYSSLDVSTQLSAVSDANGNAVFAATGLIPDTDYVAACITKSARGVLSAMKTAPFRTSCCKSVTSTLSTTSFSQGQTVLNAVTVSLDSVPTDDVTVSLSVTGAGVKGITFSPTSFTFTKGTRALSSSFVVLVDSGASAGDFMLNTVVTTSGSNQYTASLPQAVKIIAVGTPVDPPSVKSVTFSSDGSSLIVNFSGATNKKNAFSCADVLTFVGASTSICSWSADSTSINIIPGKASSSLSIGSSVAVKAGSYYAAAYASCNGNCDAWTANSAASASIVAPSNPALPTVVVAAPAQVGSCADLTIDLSGSSGAGGRSWQKPTFIVTSDDARVDTSAIAAFLNGNQYVMTPPTAIAASSLLFADVASYTLTVSAKMCNFLGACSSVSVSVLVKSGSTLPVVNVIGGGSQQTTLASGMTLTTNAYIPGCNGVPSSSKGLTYSWSVTAKDGSVALSTGVVLNYKKDSLVIPAYGLKKANAFYTATVNVTTSTSSSATTSVDIFVPATNLVPSIAGGAQQSVRTEQSISFDATGSVDNDVTPAAFNSVADYQAALATNGITYKWTCVQVSPVYMELCPAFSIDATTTSSSVLKVTSLPDNVNAVSMFTLTMSDSTRTASASVSLRVLSAGDPVLSISTTTVDSVDTTSAVALVGSVDLKASCIPSWSVDDSSLQSQLSSKTLVPLPYGRIAPTSDGTPVTLNLVLAPNAMAPRSAYTFTLSCASGSTVTSSTIQISTNGPPTPGTFAVSPLTGVEMSDKFTFTADQWTDANLPLTYQFGFVGASNTFMVIQSRSSATFGSSVLAANADGSQVEVVVQVFDALSSMATTSAKVTVTKSDPTKLAENSDSLVSDVQSGSATAAKQALATVSTVINNMDCAGNDDCVNTKANIRGQLASGLLSLATDKEADNTTPQIIAGWAANLGAVTNTPSELTPDAVSAAHGVARAALAGSTAATYSATTANNILSAIDKTLTATAAHVAARRLTHGDHEARRLQTETTSAIADLVSMSASLTSASLYPGMSSGFSTCQMSVTAASSSTGAGALSVGTSTGSADPNNPCENTSAVSVAGTSSAAAGTVNSAVVTIASTDPSQGPHVKFQIDKGWKYYKSGTNQAVFTLTIPNNGKTGDSTPSPHKLTLQCASGSTESTSYTCPDSKQVLTATCPGKKLPRTIVQNCPDIVHESTCSTLDSTSKCTKVSSTDTETVCQCTMAKGSPTSNRKLLNQQAMDDSGATDVCAMTMEVAGDAQNTFSQAGSMNSPQALAQVALVIVMFAILWGGGLVLIFGCIYRARVLGPTSYDKAAAELERRKRGAAISRSPIAIKEYLSEYVSSVIPTVFMNRPILHRLYDEIVKNHRYIILFTGTGKQSENKKILTGFQLLTTQTLLMFLLSFFYDLQAPDDDGTCTAFTTESACLARVSFLDHTQTYCQWGAPADDATTAWCTYQEPPFGWKTVAIIGFIVCVFTSIINFPIDALFELLEAPTADMYKVNSDKNAGTLTNVARQLGRRMSDVGRKVTNAVMGTTPAREVKVTSGSDVRLLPESTQTAQQLAAASMNVISSVAQRIQFQRNHLRDEMRRSSQRGRAYHGAHKGEDSDNDKFDSDTDSDIEKMDELEDNLAVRAAEKASDAEEKTGEPAPVSAEALLQELFVEITCQRRLLREDELEEYDAQWGVDPTGEFVKGQFRGDPKSLSARMRKFLCNRIHRGAAEQLKKEISEVLKESSSKVNKLKYATDSHVGLELLHMFIVDILGRETAAARIFESKSEEDFKSSTVTTKTVKGLAWCGILITNIFFIYYSMLHAYVKGFSWQQAYVAGCVLQLVLEVCLFETAECIWVNFLIPNLVTNQVTAAAKAISATIERLCNIASTDNKYFLNAPSYLFVSTNVAKAFPDLVESVIIRSYHYHLPGEISKKWHFGVTSRIANHHGATRYAFMAMLISGLQLIGASPMGLQRIIIRFSQPVSFGGVVLAFSYVLDNPPVLATFCAVVACLALYGLYKFFFAVKKEQDENALIKPEAVEDKVDDSLLAYRKKMNDLEMVNLNVSPAAASVAAPAAEVLPVFYNEDEHEQSPAEDYDPAEEGDDVDLSLPVRVAAKHPRPYVVSIDQLSSVGSVQSRGGFEEDDLTIVSDIASVLHDGSSDASGGF